MQGTRGHIYMCCSNLITVSPYIYIQISLLPQTSFRNIANTLYNVEVCFRADSQLSGAFVDSVIDVGIN